MTNQRNNELLIFIALLITSTAISYFLISFISPSNALLIVDAIPNIIGIMLTGVLAIIAIIFGLINPKEFKKLSETYHDPKIEENYQIHIDTMKSDTIILLLFFSISIILLILSKTILSSINFGIWMLFSLGIFSLLISIFAIYDIIHSLFLLNQIRSFSS